MITNMRRILFMLLVLGGLILPPPAIGANQASPTPDPAVITFTLNPVGQPDGSFFEIEAEPGSTTELAVEFANTYGEPLTLRSYVADGYTLPNGGLGVSTEGETSLPPTPWIAYPADTYELAPDEGREVTFTVTVPEDAPPGNYVSVLVLQTVEAIPVPGTDLLDQIIQKAIAIDITVPGETTPAFALGAPVYDESGNIPIVRIPLENTGDVRLRPAGTLTITDAAGTAVLTADIALGSVFARTATTIELVLQQPLPSGDYTLDLVLTDAATKAIAEVRASPLTVTSATPAAPSLVSLADVVVTPFPDAANPQFASIAGTIVNGGNPISAARLTLVALQDGAEVEQFALIPTLSVPQGETTFEQRYIPLSGFTSGTWTFQVVLESIDTASGSATVLVTQDLEGVIVVP